MQFSRPAANNPYLRVKSEDDEIESRRFFDEIDNDFGLGDDVEGKLCSLCSEDGPNTFLGKVNGLEALLNPPLLKSRRPRACAAK